MDEKELDDLWEAWVRGGSSGDDRLSLARRLVNTLCAGMENETAMSMLRLDRVRELLSIKLAEGLTDYPDIVAGWRTYLGDYEDMIAVIERAHPELASMQGGEVSAKHTAISTTDQ